MRRGPEYDVMSIADKSVAKMKQPSHEDQTALSERKSAKPAAAAVHVTHSQSDPILPNRDNDGALISNIAEDSVRFLLSGKKQHRKQYTLCYVSIYSCHRIMLDLTVKYATTHHKKIIKYDPMVSSDTLCLMPQDLGEGSVG